MELDEKLEERKRGNAPFLAAFEHVRSMLSLTKGKMCELLNVKASRLSEWDKGEKLVPEPVKYTLVQISVEKEIGQISIDYLDGYTDIMLLPNISDDELEEIKMRRSNPDYDKLKARRETKQEKIESMLNVPYGQPTPSSMFNANLAQQAESVEAFRIALNAKDKLIEDKESRINDLKKTVDDKESRISDLKRTITDKEAVIEMLKTRIAELERKLSSIAAADLDHYPFAIGAADDPHIRKPRSIT